MSFFDKIKYSIRNWMTGRYGADQLGMVTLFAGLILSVFSSFSGWGFLSFLGLVLYAITIFRMFSRNIEARRKENQKAITFISQFELKIKQFFRRLKNRKEYKYFKCPHCKQLLRLKRGCGEKEITCAKCGQHFHQKA